MPIFAPNGNARVADLHRHDLIGFDTETSFIRAAMRHLPGIDRSMFALRVDSDAAQFAAVQAGFGIGICQTAVARRDPALVRILEDELALSLPVWIVMHEDLRRVARCRAVFDALVTGMSLVANS